ncbi:hypothetical protein M0805_003464 [Coniferiporia weirii]|nr:hypothetical protein M0805_003464 [Coniferiporia weirii]
MPVSQRVRSSAPRSLSAELMPTSPTSTVDSDFPLTPRSPIFSDAEASSSCGSPSRPKEREKKGTESYDYPLRRCTGLVEVLHDDEDRIDVEEEARMYHSFDLDEEDTSTLGLSQTNVYSSQRPPRPRPSPRGRTHTRAPSSIFSNDIWVGESGDAEKSASFARGVRIVGWTSVGDKMGGAYVVYDCALLTTAGTTIHVHKRYSGFAELHTALLHALPTPTRKHLPPLPPRAPWARYRVGFLEKRRRALQNWLSGVLLHPEIGGCSVLREWVMAG